MFTRMLINMKPESFCFIRVIIVMKGCIIALYSGKSPTSSDNLKRLISLMLSFLLLSTIVFFFYTNFFPSSRDLKIVYRSSSPPTSQDITSTRIGKQCNVFRGNWIPHADWPSPYYTNATKCAIDDRQNCMKFGRPDAEFLTWRWRPDDCELPLFDGAQFLKLVKGKSMAFVGDSLARNQMQSLVCMLASVAEPLDVSHVPDARFRRWLYAEHNFTLVAFWSRHLVRSEDADPRFYPMTSLMNLYLDEVDEVWATQIENFDYVIISAGQWFLRPLMYYEKRKLIGCYFCKEKNVTDLSRSYGYKMAFRTSFRALLNLKRFNGVTFLRTFSPPHYENGEWNKGGNCLRRRPFTRQEVRLEEYVLELYLNQMEELRAAERKGKKRGLKFRLLDATKMMLMRPDGHPNHYGHGADENVALADCVHWCLPGPIDTWNEIFLQMLMLEA